MEITKTFVSSVSEYSERESLSSICPGFEKLSRNLRIDRSWQELHEPGHQPPPASDVCERFAAVRDGYDLLRGESGGSYPERFSVFIMAVSTKPGRISVTKIGSPERRARSPKDSRYWDANALVAP